MKIFGLTLLLLCLSCGGILPDKAMTRVPAGTTSSVDERVQSRLIDLKTLEQHYSATGQNEKLLIVQGMILKLKKKHPELASPEFELSPGVKERGNAFASLQLTVEHLSHRESVIRQ